MYMGLFYRFLSGKRWFLKSNNKIKYPSDWCQSGFAEYRVYSKASYPGTPSPREHIVASSKFYFIEHLDKVWWNFQFSSYTLFNPRWDNFRNLGKFPVWSFISSVTWVSLKMHIIIRRNSIDQPQNLQCIKFHQLSQVVPAPALVGFQRILATGLFVITARPCCANELDKIRRI